MFRKLLVVGFCCSVGIVKSVLEKLFVLVEFSVVEVIYVVGVG